MSGKNDELIGAELGADVPEIDIHGMGRDEAVRALEEFIQQAYMRGDTVLRIIHGRGEGILRTEVHRKLNSYELVETSRPSEHPAEVGAVTLVKLHRKT